MGLGMEIIDTFVTNPGASTVATAVFPGDVLAVRSFNPPSKAFLVDAWTAAATAGIARVRSPRLHDNVQGIRFRNPTGAVPRSLLTEWAQQQLYSQDTLITEESGGGAETEGFSLCVYYQDIGGMAARLTTIEAIMPRIVQLVNVEVACASAAAIGSRCPSVALNATFDLLIANQDYALLGYESDVTGLSIGIRGPDTGNLRVGGPMTTERIETRDWFVDLGKKLGEPTIPIINQANRAATLVDNSQVVVGVAANVTLLFAQLSQ